MSFRKRQDQVLQEIFLVSNDLWRDWENLQPLLLTGEDALPFPNKPRVFAGFNFGPSSALTLAKYTKIECSSQ